MTEMIKLANGKEVTLDEFLTWSSQKQQGNLKPPRAGMKNTEKHRAKISAIHKGKMVNAETRAKLSAKRKGKPSWGKPMMTPNGLFLSRAAVIRVSGKNPSTIDYWMKKWPEHYYYVN